ncbi:hypothetical protein BDN72DRAFT_796880 [Pluteus cervinus]|uniref:Uncharacterized protein n=1 Tax=Pluteus cervinus TaxID=181527 RepID=A0ACD3AV31_9AGAR|nr:hypothetical protein BDN72DRAFT_796880 [Pluteus cervinus]
MATNAQYLLTILPLLPPDLAGHINNLLNHPSAQTTLDTLLRFVCGGRFSIPNTPTSDQEQWYEKQQQVTKRLNELCSSNIPGVKRQRDSGPSDMDTDTQNTKRLRLEPGVTTGASGSGNASPNDHEVSIYTLHAISTTSPVRKKVDITICASSIRFTNSSTQAVEGTIPRSLIQRAFIVPTRGKSKPHWTVVLISSDTPHRGKTANASSQTNPQVIFGVDATTTGPLTVTNHKNTESPTHTHAKGSSTRPILQEFFDVLGVKLLEPTTDIFKSACPGQGAGSNGVPGVEAYRAAKVGSLWFTREGILWGESKPCEFWAVEDLLGKTDGVRVITATGRNCTLVLTRKSTAPEGVGEDDDGEDVGEETQFGPIDAKEQDGINQWVRQHRHLFGKQKGSSDIEVVPEKRAKATGSNSGPMTIKQIGDESDEDDEDFEVDTEEEDGGSASSSGEDSDNDSEGGGAAASGDVEGDEDDDAEGDSDEDDEMEDAPLKAENHPLLRPGAMPKMSRAAMDMAVKIVEGDLVGGSEEDEQDELED